MQLKIQGQRPPKNGDWKTNLYEFCDSREIEFREKQDDGTTDIVYTRFSLNGGQRGFYSHEYRPPFIQRDNAKSVDIWVFIVDDTEKKFNIWLMDVKDNMSIAKNVVQFLEQIAVSLLHKSVFDIYTEEFMQELHLGYITRKMNPDDIKNYIHKQEQPESVEENPEFQSTIGAKKRNIRRSLPNKQDLRALKLFLDNKIELKGENYSLECHLMTPQPDGNYLFELEVACS